MDLRDPFLYIYIYVGKIITFLDVHSIENQHLSLMYTMYANASNKYPSYTHVKSYMVQRVHP